MTLAVQVLRAAQTAQWRFIMRILSTLAAGLVAIAPIISFMQARVNWLRRSRAQGNNFGAPAIAMQDYHAHDHLLMSTMRLAISHFIDNLIVN
jgi:hypothetical protein